MRPALHRASPASTTLFLCDIQTRFVPTIHCYAQVVSTAQKMLSAANILQMPVVVTEQYPKGLVFRLIGSLPRARERRWTSCPR